MAPAVADRIVTAEELLKHPEWDRCELVGGKVLFMSPAGGRHGEIAGVIFGLIFIYLQSNKVGKVFSAETGVILERDPDTVRVPDVMFLSTSRIPSSGIPVGYIPVAPDLAVEVVSPNDRFSEVTAKAESYLHAGTRLVWVIDPETSRAYVFKMGRDVLTLDDKQSLSGEDVLPGFALKLAELFKK